MSLPAVGEAAEDRQREQELFPPGPRHLILFPGNALDKLLLIGNKLASRTADLSNCD